MSKIYVQVQGDKMNGDVVQKGQGAQTLSNIAILDSNKRVMANVMIGYDAEDGIGAYHIEFTDALGSGCEFTTRMRVEEKCFDHAECRLNGGVPVINDSSFHKGEKQKGEQQNDCMCVDGGGKPHYHIGTGTYFA